MTLTAPQRDMLKRLAAARYGELFIRGAGFRTYDALGKRGLVERYPLGGWGKITPEGRAAITPLSSEGTER